jgi:hypothetical protein
VHTAPGQVEIAVGLDGAVAVGVAAETHVHPESSGRGMQRSVAFGHAPPHIRGAMKSHGCSVVGVGVAVTVCVGGRVTVGVAVGVRVAEGVGVQVDGWRRTSTSSR